ncbi:hypothetical protein [Aurantibacter sp.]|uniref:hypothetical protein n=1 Tax=Aurantibacter sp. TaxID=2807103 RepID=UPI0035C79A89
MKKLFLSILAVSALFTSCSNDDDNSTTASGSTPIFVGSDLSNAEITGNTSLVATTEYTLQGKLEILNGGQLTIPAGTVIKAQGGNNTYIAVDRDSKIFINGEPNNPVVMTSSAASPAAEDWGGLVICGNAPSNTGDDSVSEVAGLTYGGNETNHSSGVVKYLRIEYTGSSFNASKEFNGVSFFGVGAGTEVKNILAFESGDDGIEFFGGTVNASKLAIINAYDDSLDCADGFSGTIDGLYIEGVTKGAMEISNNGDNEAQTPETDAKVMNATIVRGDATLFAASENVVNYKEGGGNQTYTNIAFTGFDKFAKYSSDDTTQANVTAGKLDVVSFRTDDTVNATYDEKGVLGTSNSSLVGAGSGLSKPSWVAELE